MIGARIGTQTHGCLACGRQELAPVLNLGTQALTGVFPASAEEPVPSGPLQLVRCVSGCGLVQLRHHYPAPLLYGDGYGYRSGLNKSMVNHLRWVWEWSLTRVGYLSTADYVLDIGSNDGTLLSCFAPEATLVGMDPTISKFGSYYRDDILDIADFFTSSLWRQFFGSIRAKLITSIAMFYDLTDPVWFAKDIAEVLAPDGVWVTEQSYLPTMLRQNSYDTICHEHLEYYGLHQIAYIASRADLKVIDVELTDANGGSFIVALVHAASERQPTARVSELMKSEESLVESGAFERFTEAAAAHRATLITVLARSAARGMKTFGYGASTKGNVILQYCGLTANELPYFAEVNQEKFGHVTPGSNIPIISEAEARAMRPDQFLVMPWHFHDSIVVREREYLRSGGRLLFPLPDVELMSGSEVAA